MSKSLGNSPDLLELIDKYGADAVRFGIMISSPAGNDLLFDEASLEQGKFFNNKLWNALKLVKSWESKISNDAAPEHFPMEWFGNRLKEARASVDALMKEFRLSEALKMIYSLIWDDFCSWYLEWVKPGFEQPVHGKTYDRTVQYFEDLLQMLHPYMPFITEEIYHLLKEQQDDLCIRQFSEAGAPDTALLVSGARLKDDITAVRDFRKKYNLKNTEQVAFYMNATANTAYAQTPLREDAFRILQKQTSLAHQPALAGDLPFIQNAQAHNQEIVVVSSDHQFSLYLDKQVDQSLQKEELLKDLDHLKGFLQAVEKKLANERFLQNARPEVVALEKKKKSDAEEKIRVIEDSLKNMK